MRDSSHDPLADTIDLYLASFEAGPDDDLVGRYRAIMSDEECERQRRFHFERDRRRFALTRALTRTCLSRYVAVDPADWRFRATEYGRPEISLMLEGPKLCFNIAHTKYLVIIAVTTGRSVGVDVENKALRAAPLDIADQFFAPPEVTALRALPPLEQSERFFDYWTLKEAYIKARGKGLSIGLESFYYEFVKPDGVRLTIVDPALDRAERWRLWQFGIGTDYVGALCAEAGPNPIAIRAFETVPMISCRPAPLTITRSSAATDRVVSFHQKEPW